MSGLPSSIIPVRASLSYPILRSEGSCSKVPKTLTPPPLNAPGVPKDKELDRIEFALWKIKSSARGKGVREERKTESEVWDRATLDAIYRLMTKGLVDTVDFPISTGKEANVFHATTPEGGSIVVKVYRTSTADFKAIEQYIFGDPRFHGRRRSTRDIIYTWARKESLNLRRAFDAGVPVPEPLGQHRNVLAMSYIGDEERPAPELRQVRLEDPQAFFEEVMDAAALLFEEGGLIHGDLSEFNILVQDGSPILIDLGQAMLLKHPRALELLQRDAANMARYFGRLGVEVTPEDVMDRIKGTEEAEAEE
jgi:RIO kinase 1